LLLSRRRYSLFIDSLWEASAIALIASGSCTATISFEALTYLGGKSQQKLASDRIHGLQKVFQEQRCIAVGQRDICLWVGR